MAQIFPKKANTLPLLSLVGAGVGGVLLLFLVWYYFSPEFTDVGYAPEQPVAFSHRQHAGQLGMDCRYCHNQVELSSHANVPPTQTCMNCHNQIKTASLKLLPVRESWATGKPVEWVNVHMLPDYAHFSHAAHVTSGVGCETCHGRIDQQQLAAKVQPLYMGWCLSCHRNVEDNIRPPDQVFNMDWQPAADPATLGVSLIKEYGIQTQNLTNCAICHR